MSDAVPRRWVVAQHAPDEGPGLLGEVLARAGVDVDVVRLDLGDELPDPNACGAVVAMGGPMGVHDQHGWLDDERRWLATAARSGVPVLGICLGAQQLAASLGASVQAGPAPEVGLGSVELTDAGRADAVLGPEGATLAVVHWHGDTFGIPDQAVHLASSERCRNQAFRYGDLVYGLQFHVEVDEDLAAAWAPGLPSGVRLGDAGLGAVEAAGRRVLGRFVDAVLALER